MKKRLSNALTRSFCVDGSQSTTCRASCRGTTVVWISAFFFASRFHSYAYIGMAAWQLSSYDVNSAERVQILNETVCISHSATHHHHHHHVLPPTRISLTLSRHFSLSFIASSWSSGLHPVSSHSCCMYVRAGRSAFARPHVVSP